MAAVLRPRSQPVNLGHLLDLLPDAQLAGPSTGVVTDPAGADRALLDLPISGIELDSRLVQPGDLFAALPGHRMHGVQFAGQAFDRGACALLTDAAGWAQACADGCVPVPVVVVDDPRGRLGRLSAELYHDPAGHLALLAVTGTNGKTTVAAMLQAGLRAAGLVAGGIGTLGANIQDRWFAGTRTTPEAPHLHAMLAAMREQGAQAVALEVSSHALAERRVDGLRFTVSGFTNLTQDHLDYHPSMEDYFLAKASLFTAEHTEFAVIGIDDAWGQRLASMLTIPYATWSATGRPADWMLVADRDGWRIEGPGAQRQPIQVGVPGAFNRANAVCAFAMLRRLGIPGPTIAEGLAAVRVPGRMESVGPGPVRAIVDYAHSPDAIERAIASVRDQQAGRIIVVLGAGGDRDQSKRPLMGAAAARLADVLVVTDDNPRSEDPVRIRAAILEGATSVTHADGGVAEVLHVPDRAQAIRTAVARAETSDTVLVLGKGHELGQEIGGVVHPFDDRAVLAEALAGATEHGPRCP